MIAQNPDETIKPLLTCNRPIIELLFIRCDILHMTFGKTFLFQCLAPTPAKLLHFLPWCNEIAKRQSAELGIGAMLAAFINERPHCHDDRLAAPSSHAGQLLQSADHGPLALWYGKCNIAFRLMELPQPTRSRKGRSMPSNGPFSGPLRDAGNHRT